jgi:hypothetical protein
MKRDEIENEKRDGTHKRTQKKTPPSGGVDTSVKAV